MAKKLLIGVLIFTASFFFNFKTVFATDQFWGCNFQSSVNVFANTKYAVSYKHSDSIVDYSAGTSGVFTPNYWVRDTDSSPWNPINNGAPYNKFGPKINFFNGGTQVDGMNSNSPTEPITGQQPGEAAYEWQPASDFSLSRVEFYSSDPGTAMIRLWNETLGPDGVDNIPNQILAQCAVVPNQPTAVLTANAGGPYTGVEGTAVTLDASGSTDTNATIVSYQWDLGSGQFTDATGVTVSHTWYDEFNGPIRVQVTDSQGNIAIASANVTIANVAPTAKISGGNLTLTSGQPASFTGSYTDPSTQDTFTTLWTFGDGSQVTGTLTPTHTFYKTGTYPVTFQVTDDDGGVGTATVQVTVNPISTKIAFFPKLLNLKSPWQNVLAFLWLPKGYNLSDVNLNTVKLNSTVPAVMMKVVPNINDDDCDADLACRFFNQFLPFLKIKFNRQQAAATLRVGKMVPVTVSGNLNNGTAFQGTDYIWLVFSN